MLFFKESLLRAVSAVTWGFFFLGLLSVVAQTALFLHLRKMTSIRTGTQNLVVVSWILIRNYIGELNKTVKWSWSLRSVYICTTHGMQGNVYQLLVCAFGSRFHPSAPVILCASCWSSSSSSSYTVVSISPSVSMSSLLVKQPSSHQSSFSNQYPILPSRCIIIVMSDVVVLLVDPRAMELWEHLEFHPWSCIHEREGEWWREKRAMI